MLLRKVGQCPPSSGGRGGGRCRGGGDSGGDGLDFGSSWDGDDVGDVFHLQPR